MDHNDQRHSYYGMDRVCCHCMLDEALADHVVKAGERGRCDFCDSTNEFVVFVSDLFDHMLECLLAEHTPAPYSTEVAAPSWDIDTPGERSRDLLGSLDDPLGDDTPLMRLFVDAFTDDWVDNGVWAGTPDEWLTEGWQTFVDTVRNHNRFMFLHPATAQPQHRPVDIDHTRMLDDLNEVLHDCCAVISFPAGQTVHRARKHAPQTALTESSDLGPPPAALAGNQRMSPPGISYFYAALDDETALAEIRGVDGEVATCSTWILRRDVDIVDLDRIDEIPSIFDLERQRLRAAFLFLRVFVREITKPIRAHDNPAVDYVPTQIVAGYLHHCVTGLSGDAVKAVMYPSVARSQGTNIAFFVDAEDLAAADPLLVLYDRPRRYEAKQTTTNWDLLTD